MSAAYVVSAFGAAMLVGVLPYLVAWGLLCLVERRTARPATPRHASGGAGARERRPLAADDRSVPSGRPSVPTSDPLSPPRITKSSRITKREGLYPS